MSHDTELRSIYLHPIVLSFLGLYNCVATKVEVFNEDTGKLETFSLLKEGELPFIDKYKKGNDRQIVG